jgi:2-dehydropantoate 2-reductase
VSERVAVLGAGANGASIGADLTVAGADVTLIEQWPAHVEAMRDRGLDIHSGGEVLHVQPRTLHLCEVATLRHRFDVVLVLMKAYDTGWATQLIAPYLAEDGVIAAVQNGMSTQAVADVIGNDRAVATVIEVSSTMTDPGVVHRHSGPERSWFAVDAAGKGDRVAQLLQSAGRVARFDDIQSAKWMKLVSNSSVLVTTAILGLPMLDAIAAPGMRRLMIRSGQEALAVGLARGHRILPIFGLAEADVAEPDRVVETMLDVLYDGFVVPGATTTVLQDWTKSRRSEAGDLNGTVVAEGARLGVPTPVNAAVMAVAGRVERGELTPGPEAGKALFDAVA